MTAALEPPQNVLRELFDYCPDKGELLWRVARSNKVKIGTSAGSFNKVLGYFTIGIKHEGVNRRYYRHRLIYTWHHGAIPDDAEGKTMVIDHRKGTDIPCFDRIENLRCGSRGENALNKAMDVRNQSGASGVWQRTDTGRWTARIGFEKAQIGLGTFDTMQEAVDARLLAEKARFGEWSRVSQAPSFVGLS